MRSNKHPPNGIRETDTALAAPYRCLRELVARRPLSRAVVVVVTVVVVVVVVVRRWVV